MSKHRAFSLVLPILIMLLLSACTGSPAIRVQPAEFDFGDISPLAPVNTTLQVHNRGRGELTITGVSTSCGCTTATVAQPTLAPGQTTALQVTFDPQAHPGLYGPLLRMVYLQSNDSSQPELEIPITVNILAPN